jgi:hypothetical protein
MAVPVRDPDENAIERFRFEVEAEDTWPVTLNDDPETVVGKQEPEGLVMAVTVPVSTFPFWLKLIVITVLCAGVLVDWANTAFQVPVTTGV